MSTGTTTNYTGRLVDISLFPALTEPQKLESLEFGIATKAISGPLKAAQNFLRTFLTPKGERRGVPDWGTNIMKYMRGGYYFITDGEFRQVFNLEAQAAVRQMRSLVDDSTPVDEQVAVAELSDFSISSTSYRIRVSVTMIGGQTLELPVPVSWKVD